MAIYKDRSSDNCVSVYYATDHKMELRQTIIVPRMKELRPFAVVHKKGVEGCVDRQTVALTLRLYKKF